MSSTLYIVGGGPSLKGFDWQRLQGCRVLAVNRSAEFVPWAEAVYFSDRRCFHWYKKMFTSHAAQLYTGHKHIDDPRVKFVRWTGISGLETRPMHLRHGNNSGYTAINLAYHLGGTRLVLLGFDMQPDADGNHHHHAEHPVAMRPRAYQNMLRYFPTLVKPCQVRGIDIFNASPSSAITCFPRVALDDVVPGRAAA